MHFWVADSAAPPMQSMGNITNLRLWLCCAPNTHQNRAFAIATLDTVRTEFDLQAGCRQFCAQSYQHVWRGIWAPSFLNRLPCSWRAPSRPWWQDAAQTPLTASSKKRRRQRRIVIPFLLEGCDSIGCSPLGQERLKHLGYNAQQLGRTHSNTRDIGFDQQHWRFFVITRELRGFVVAVVGGIVTVSRREAASQQPHKADQQCAGTKRDRPHLAVRSVRSGVWMFDVVSCRLGRWSRQRFLGNDLI